MKKIVDVYYKYITISFDSLDNGYVFMKWFTNNYLGVLDNSGVMINISLEYHPNLVDEYGDKTPGIVIITSKSKEVIKTINNQIIELYER